MTAGLSSSALVYLFCDRAITPEPKRNRRRITPPCGGPEVSLAELAAVALGISLWSLRERGVVRLEQVQKKRLLRGPAARVQVVAENPVEGAPTTLEEATAARAASKRNFKDIRGMIIRTNYNPADPWISLVSIVWGECARAGLGEIVVPPLGKRFVGVDPRFELRDCSLRDPYEPAFEDVWQRWERFGSDEPELRAGLLEECAVGLSRRHDDGSGAVVAGASS